MPHTIYLGIDTGGTFTDFVVLKHGELRVHKVLTTPDAPAKAILAGIADLDLLEDMVAGRIRVIHGTTVATNATLEGKGVSTAYVTNRGMGDLLTIGRQTRADLYDLMPTRTEPPVEPGLVVECGGRMDFSGNVIEDLTSAEVDEIHAQLLTLGPKAVAINLLFSFVDDRFERMIEDRLKNDFFVARSSSVLPVYREYERGIATWLNAWLGPIIEQYLLSLNESLAPSTLAIMQSSGGTISARNASKRAVNLLLSGPVGGLSATQFVSGGEKVMTFDMGGTSTDVALIDGKFNLTNEGKIGPYPVAIPMADIHTIGAGGGSIAYIDAGGLLQVGPESAGASPGPACYGFGGTKPTVTDANFVLGRLRADAFLGGRLNLDQEAATRAIGTLSEQLSLSNAEAAGGIITIANERMVQALRVISIQRGFDPKEFSLVTFGGAGGLHLCDLANALAIPKALVPINSGVFSALGMLVANPSRQLSRTYQHPLNELDMDTINQLLEELSRRGRNELIEEGVPAASIRSERSLDLRYHGQSYTLNVPWTDDLSQAEETFHQRHQARYGHHLDKQVELLNLRAKVTAPATSLRLPKIPAHTGHTEKTIHLTGIDGPTTLLRREELGHGFEIAGPALITEDVSTTLVLSGWLAQVDQYGHLKLTKL